MPEADERAGGRGSWRRAVLILMVAGGTAIGLAALTVGYWNVAGLPQVFQSRIQQAFRDRGWEFQAGKVRLKGWRRLEARQARISNSADGLQVDLPWISLDLPLFSREWALVTQGEVLIHAVNPSNRFESETLHLTDVQLSARIDQDEWEIRDLSARLGPLAIQGGAELRHLSALRRWLDRPETTERPERWRAHLFAAARRLNRTAFGEGSRLSIFIAADGRRTESARGSIEADLPRLIVSSGEVEGARLAMEVVPTPDGTALRGKWRVDIGRVASAWGEAGGLALESEAAVLWQEGMRLTAASHQARIQWLQTSWGSLGPAEASVRHDPNGSGRWTTSVAAGLDRLKGNWGTSSKAEVEGVWEHGDGWDVLWQAEMRIRSANLILAEGKAGTGSMALRVKPAVFELPPADDGENRWRVLQPFQAEGEAEFQELEVRGVPAELLSGSFDWRWPLLALHRVEGKLAGGSLQAEATASALRPEFAARVGFDFDVHQIAPLLTTNAQRWLKQFSWETPPKVQGEVRLALPDWDLGALAWRKDVLPRLEIEGAFSGARGGYRGIPIEEAWSEFTLTNLLWHLPDLHVGRPEGDARLRISWSMEDRSFFLGVSSLVDPRVIREAAGAEPVQRFLEWFEFSKPPFVLGRAWGRWGEWKEAHWELGVTADDFLFRGEACDLFRGEGRYAQGALSFGEVTIRQGRQHIYVPEGVYRPEEGVIIVTNAVSSMDPDLVTRVIGPRIRAAIKPYRFGTPPLVRIQGSLPVRRVSDADVHFEVRGNEFSYWKFRVAEVSGKVHWKGEAMRLEDVDASFYGGGMRMDGRFEFSPGEAAIFSFRSGVRRVDLNALARDVLRDDSALEGVLDGELVITLGNSRDLQSWRGFGFMMVEDGYLWEVPIFGLFSPVLNSFSPGLGNTRFNSASASFLISDGGVRTDNLELMSVPVTLLYHGEVDLAGNVQARMLAEILRQTWAIGPVLNLMLRPLSKAFEYEISGSIEAPVVEPVYLPSFTFQPLRTLRRWFSGRGRNAGIPTGEGRPRRSE